MMNPATYTPTNPTASPARQPRPIIPVHQPVIKVLGLGGGGSNAVNRMIELGLAGVDFIAANTDHQALETSLAPVKIHLGPKATRGLGAGGNPAVGRSAAEESFRQIASALQGADMVFLTAGMGGGTGTGSIPVAAQIARRLGAVTIAVVTTPFSFEMGRRQKNANEGLMLLRPNTDTLISIPNDRLLQVAPRNLPLEVAFRLADDVLRKAVQGITELITRPGMINVDFANVRHLMKLGGGALMSIGQGQGEDKAIKAIEQAVHHPLLEDTSISNAAGVLINFTSGKDLSLMEVQTAVEYVQEQAGPQAEVVMGLIHDENMEDRVEVILVITGLGARSVEEAIPGFIPMAQPRPVAQQEPEPAMAEPVEQPAMQARPAIRLETMPAMTDLDVPAFMRRARSF